MIPESQVLVPCPDCRGTGWAIANEAECPRCDTDGTVLATTLDEDER